MSRIELFLLILSLFSIASTQSVVQTESAIVTEAPQITSPTSGQVLQGLVPIRINLPAQVASAELAFSYDGDPRDNWFLIAEFTDLEAGVLEINWDTTTLTDDNYTLRLLVWTSSGSITFLVTGLRVRNYMPIETTTPKPTSTAIPQETLSPSLIPTTTMSTPPPTMTPLPSNPAQISMQEIMASAGKGMGVALTIFLLIGIYRTVSLRGRC